MELNNCHMKINIDFTFKDYKILKIRNNIRNNKFLIFANNNIVLKKKERKKISLNKQKITNKSFFLTIRKSLFKNFIKFINGSIYVYFFCKKKFKPTKNAVLNKKNLSYMNVLIFKLNNKIYSSKKFGTSNFATYQENIIILFQFNNSGLKNIFK